ncbi:MAG: 2-oxoacid:acceptor oxidoreductase family protein [Oscillospiraceae bacterium]|jgi:2-oxoglutarate ferredoxin oxidoreductase subunit gamma|nr:2-oxoacid:acceptor oxidoreductase family protein [Oscillospiraceae bacterium]
MKTYEILTAGFGGQGILFAGKLLAEIGLLDNKEVSWFPSYGPAMRGGTCNCSVVVSDTPIGSPVVSEPNLLIAMNGPSYEKFIGVVKSGGKAFIDSTLANTAASSVKAGAGVEVYEVPATKLAVDNDLIGMANIIMLGKLIKETNFASPDIVEKAMKLVTEGKEHLYDLNMKALKIGKEF